MILKRLILAAAALQLLAAGLAAQELPSLGKASEITVGELPNGVSYYLVSSKSRPGYADFAIVQPSRPASSDPRHDLESLPHFRNRKPWRFLADIGVHYGERGFIRNQRDAVVMRFAGVPVSDTPAADSVLLMLTDITLASPYRQAIVISGDIDVNAIRERLRILSMTVPERIACESAYSYEWHPHDSAVVTTSTGPVSSLRITYRSPRTDPGLMNTIQPVMSKVLAAEFDLVLRQRVRAAFSSAGIPLADCRYSYVGSDGTAGDELFVLSVDTAPDKLYEAVETVAGVLAELDNGGVTTQETTFSRSVVSAASGRDSNNSAPSNQEYLDKCISSYLYGANLASATTLNAIFQGRRLDINRERELLSRYISATLSPTRNLHIYARSIIKPDEAEVLARFSDGWKKGFAAAPDIPTQEDTLLFRQHKGKVKVRSTSTDSFSGGKMWTFSNGVSVIFKKTADKGAFYYGYLVRGGWTEIQGITGPESAFASDVAGMQKVSGMTGEHLRNLLAMNGITLDCDVLISDVRYTGKAPSDRLSLVLKTIQALGLEQEPDPEAFSRYRSEEAIRLVRDRYSASGIRASLDSAMSPQYLYTRGQMPGLPGDDFPLRVGSYLATKGLSTNNATIVLAGDLDEATTFRMVSQMLGGFAPSKQRVARPRPGYPVRQCWSTTSATGGWRDRGVTVAMSALWPFTAEGNSLLQLCSAALEAELSRSLAGNGYRFQVTADAELLPAEMVAMYVYCYPVTPGGLPEGVRAVSPAVALNAVRSAVNRLATGSISPEVLARARAAVKSSGTASSSSTAALRDFILYRTSLGRDIGNSQGSRASTLGASDIQAMFAALDGCKCEFAVQ
ncbi:MAG: hypothetical protein J5759_04950 [Bacteroidales bacterium]|nr:hypothetical protein [Bacteroidales bacterium]